MTRSLRTILVLGVTLAALGVALLAIAGAASALPPRDPEPEQTGTSGSDPVDPGDSTPPPPAPSNPTTTPPDPALVLMRIKQAVDACPTVYVGENEQHEEVYVVQCPPEPPQPDPESLRGLWEFVLQSWSAGQLDAGSMPSHADYNKHDTVEDNKEEQQEIRDRTAAAKALLNPPADFSEHSKALAAQIRDNLAAYDLLGNVTLAGVFAILASDLGPASFHLPEVAEALEALPEIAAGTARQLIDLELAKHYSPFPPTEDKWWKTVRKALAQH